VILLFLPSRLRRRLRQRVPLIRMTDLALVIFITSWVFTFVLRYVEDIGWTEAIWQVWQTATTVGFGNRPAETVVGRYATMVFGMFEIIMFGAGIGAVFDFRHELRERRRSGQMRSRQRKGYVIFNFPGETDFASLVRELRYMEEDAPLCVVDDRIEHLPSNVATLPNIHFVRGSTLAQETYHRARLQECKAVIVFPTDRAAAESDGTTKTVVDLVGRFVDETTRVIHVLVDAANGWMFDDARSTPILESLEVLAIVQECQDVHSAEVVQQLLLNTEGANPQSVTPKRVIGWTWGDLVRYAIPSTERFGHEVNPLAIVKNGAAKLCPANSTPIDEDDSLLLAALGRLNWDAFEACLVEMRASDDRR